MPEQYIRKVIKNGRGSYYINIPAEMARELKIRERHKKIIRERGGKIIIEDWKK